MTPAISRVRPCFPVPSRLAAIPVAVCLDDEHGAALAHLLSLLGCGEQAACLAFDRLGAGIAAQRQALASIADDERVHDALVRGLLDQLPTVQTDDAAHTAMRRVHCRLGQSDETLQCAGIAALDSAVCTLLSALLRNQTAFPASDGAGAVLRRIRDDEARHVMITREIALTSSRHSMIRDAGARARQELGAALALAADHFEQLGFDPDTLLRAIVRLPDGLLSA
jgi:hypothetical protein